MRFNPRRTASRSTVPRRTLNIRQPLYLFSYGSNNPRQLSERLGRPIHGEPAFIRDWLRAFRGWSQRWGGGVGTLIPGRGTTFGYIAEVDEDDLARLDVYEGVQSGNYRREFLPVFREDGELLDAIVYLSNSSEKNPPSQAYLRAVADTIGTFWIGENGPVRPSDITVRNNPRTDGVYAVRLRRNGKTIAFLGYYATFRDAVRNWLRQEREYQRTYGPLERLQHMTERVIVDLAQNQYVDRDEIIAFAADEGLLKSHESLSNPASSIEANVAEINKLLARMPSEWKAQLESSRQKLRAAGARPEELPPLRLDARGALKALNLNNQGAISSEAGVRSSGDPVPEDVRKAAMDGIRLSHKNNYGGYDFIGVARAIQLAISPSISSQAKNRMRMYFDRKTKQDRLSDQYRMKSGRRYWSWLNWGGDPGARWSGSSRFKQSIHSNPGASWKY